MPIIWLLTAGAFLAATFMIAPLQSGLLRVITGMHAILIDATIIQDNRAGGLQRMADGTVLFWGLPKKALAQSLPWLGCLAALAGLARAERRQSILFVLIIFAGWSVPFVVGSWHGGFGANMRYFLPSVVLLAILGTLGCVCCGTTLPLGIVRGSGSVAQEEREVRGVSAVELSNVGNLHIDVGESEGLRIEAE